MLKCQVRGHLVRTLAPRDLSSFSSSSIYLLLLLFFFLLKASVRAYLKWPATWGRFWPRLWLFGLSVSRLSRFFCFFLYYLFFIVCSWCQIVCPHKCYTNVVYVVCGWQHPQAPLQSGSTSGACGCLESQKQTNSVGFVISHLTAAKRNSNLAKNAKRKYKIK